MANTQVCSETGEAALYHYRWAWGEEGFASQTGRILLEQKAKNLKRPEKFGAAIVFDLLPDTDAKPMELEERAQAHGKIYALTEELRLKSEKLVELNNQLTTTARDLRISEVQRVGLETELGDAKKDWAKTVESLQAARRESKAWEEKANHFQSLVTGDGAQAVKDLQAKVSELEAANLDLQAELEAAHGRLAELNDGR